MKTWTGSSVGACPTAESSNTQIQFHWATTLVTAPSTTFGFKKSTSAQEIAPVWPTSSPVQAPLSFPAPVLLTSNGKKVVHDARCNVSRFLMPNPMPYNRSINANADLDSIGTPKTILARSTASKSGTLKTESMTLTALAKIIKSSIHKPSPAPP